MRRNWFNLSYFLRPSTSHLNNAEYTYNIFMLLFAIKTSKRERYSVPCVPLLYCTSIFLYSIHATHVCVVSTRALSCCSNQKWFQNISTLIYKSGSTASTQKYFRLHPINFGQILFRRLWVPQARGTFFDIFGCRFVVMFSVSRRQHTSAWGRRLWVPQVRGTFFDILLCTSLHVCCLLLLRVCVRRV